MSIIIFAQVILLISFSSNIKAFIGITPMYGNIIIPLEDVNVRLSEITIEIEDIIGEASSEFLLENLDDKEVTFKVAFPIESNCRGCTDIQEDFRVLINEMSIDYTVIPNLTSSKINNKYDAGYTWTMSLKPKEKKSIRCVLRLGGSMDPPVEYLRYNFNNAKYWKEEIESITVRLKLGKNLIEHIESGDKKLPPAIIIEPGGYSISNSTLEWHFSKGRIPQNLYVEIDYSGPSIERSPDTRFEGEIVLDRFYILKIDGSSPDKEITLTQRKRKGGNYTEPKWSPDGKYIAYIGQSPPYKTDNVFLMDKDGRNKRNITNFDYGIIFDIEWDITGNEILFSYNPNKPNEKLCTKSINIKTGVLKDIHYKYKNIDNCTHTIFSPNKDVLLCYEWLSFQKERMNIYQKVNNIKGNNQNTIKIRDSIYLKKNEITLENASYPLWSRDSSKFIFLIDGYLTIFNKDGNEIFRKKSNLCYKREPICLKSWPINSENILYTCHCGLEGTQEKFFILDLENMKSEYITEGYNPDWFINDASKK